MSKQDLFIPRCVKGFPENNSVAIRKHTYSMDRKKKDLLDEYRIDKRAYFVRADVEGLRCNEDMDYLIDTSMLSAPRESPDLWHPLDFIVFLMVDRLGNWIGWIEVDYTYDGRSPTQGCDPSDTVAS